MSAKPWNFRSFARVAETSCVYITPIMGGSAPAGPWVGVSPVSTAQPATKHESNSDEASLMDPPRLRGFAESRGAEASSRWPRRFRKTGWGGAWNRWSPSGTKARSGAWTASGSLAGSLRECVDGQVMLVGRDARQEPDACGGCEEGRHEGAPRVGPEGQGGIVLREERRVRREEDREPVG